CHLNTIAFLVHSIMVHRTLKMSKPSFGMTLPLFMSLILFPVIPSTSLPSILFLISSNIIVLIITKVFSLFANFLVMQQAQYMSSKKNNLFHIFFPKLSHSATGSFLFASVSLQFESLVMPSNAVMASKLHVKLPVMFFL